MKNNQVSPNFKQDLFQMASNLNKASKGWIVSYDPETDSLSYSVEKLSMGTKINYLDDEIAVYLSSNNEVEGVFIEYVTKNYLSHNKNLKDFKKMLIDLEKEKGDDDFIKVKKSDAKNFIHILQKEMQDIVENSINIPTNIAF